MARERRASVEISEVDAHLFEVGKSLTVDAAWKCGLYATAQWVVEEVSHAMAGGKYVCMVSVRRMTTD